MILEQAFTHLPEVLHGSGYQQQSYEAGIVGAFALAVLQALNGRNVANPIACMQFERQFRAGGKYTGLEKARYLRADLFVDIERLYVANRRLAQYGWRHDSWIEAKFLRNQAGDGTSHSGNKTAHTASFIADIIRLAALVPETKSKYSSHGRYFLHVYDADPKFYLTVTTRDWAKAICTPGSQSIKIDAIDALPPTIRRLLGEFRDLSVSAEITTSAITPTNTTHRPCYWMYLTRLDDVKVQWGTHSFHVASDRKVTMSSDGALDLIAAYVAETIHVAVASAEEEPPAEESVAGEDVEPPANEEDIREVDSV